MLPPLWLVFDGCGTTSTVVPSRRRHARRGSGPGLEPREHERTVGTRVGDPEQPARGEVGGEREAEQAPLTDGRHEAPDVEVGPGDPVAAHDADAPLLLHDEQPAGAVRCGGDEHRLHEARDERARDDAQPGDRGGRHRRRDDRGRCDERATTGGRATLDSRAADRGRGGHHRREAERERGTREQPAGPDHRRHGTSCRSTVREDPAGVSRAPAREACAPGPRGPPRPPSSTRDRRRRLARPHAADPPEPGAGRAR